MAEFLGQEWREEVIALWQICFGDDRAYIENFLNHYLPQTTLFGQIQDGHLASMMFLLPAVLHSPDGKHPLRYIYAVGTVPALRGNGFAGRLLEEAAEWLKEKKETAILVPATADLFEYYKKRGFTEYIFMEEITEPVPASRKREYDKKKPVYERQVQVHAAGLEEESFSFTPMNAKEYKRLRDQYFERTGYICWREEAVAYALKENEAAGGFCNYIRWENEEYAILGRVEKTELIIKEITADREEAVVLARRLAQELGCRRFSMRLRAEAGSVRKAFALALPIKEQGVWEQGYLNLILD